MSIRTRLRLEGLNSVTDIGHLEKQLEAVPRVQAVEIDSENDQVIIEHDGADLEKLTTVATDAGYRVKLL